MKKLHRIIPILLALVMMLSLCACGGKTEAPKTEAPKTEAPKDNPVVPTPEPAAAVEEEKPAGTAVAKRVLIADDQKVNLIVLTTMLKIKARHQNGYGFSSEKIRMIVFVLNFA